MYEMTEEQIEELVSGALAEFGLRVPHYFSDALCRPPAPEYKQDLQRHGGELHPHWRLGYVMNDGTRNGGWWIIKPRTPEARQQVRAAIARDIAWMAEMAREAGLNARQIRLLETPIRERWEAVAQRGLWGKVIGTMSGTPVECRGRNTFAGQPYQRGWSPVTAGTHHNTRREAAQWSDLLQQVARESDIAAIHDEA